MHSIGVGEVGEGGGGKGVKYFNLSENLIQFLNTDSYRVKAGCIVQDTRSYRPIYSGHYIKAMRRDACPVIRIFYMGLLATAIKNLGSFSYSFSRRKIINVLTA